MNIFKKIFVWFVKISGWPVEIFYYRKKVFYETNKYKINGGALIVSNHRSIMDSPLYMYVFNYRILRTVTAEVIYRKGKLMTWFLNMMGCIKVDRYSSDLNFVFQSGEVLRNDGCVLLFPESRIPDELGGKLSDFKPLYIKIALENNVPIIPCYTNGKYGKNAKARIMIGDKIYLNELYDKNKSEKENIESLNDYVRNYIIRLEEKLDEKQ